MSDEKLVPTDYEIPPEAAEVLDAREEEALRMEGEMIEPTDNGWKEGDPDDQPENPEPQEQQ